MGLTLKEKQIIEMAKSKKYVTFKDLTSIYKTPRIISETLQRLVRLKQLELRENNKFYYCGNDFIDIPKCPIKKYLRIAYLMGINNSTEEHFNDWLDEIDI